MTTFPGPEAVTDWLTLPDLAERLGVELRRARQLVQERVIVGVRRGERNVFVVPAAFVGPDADLLPALPGTISLLTDLGLTDAEILGWLFTEDRSTDGTPIEALRAGRRAAVRRAAQMLG